MSRHFQTRCIVLCSVLVAGLSLLSGRLIQIQLVDRQRYAESGRKAFQEVEKLPAMRGMIVDRREEPLAKSIPVSTVFVNKSHLYDPKLASFGLAYQAAQTEPRWGALEAKDRKRLIHSIRGDILARDPADVIVEKHLAYAVGILARPLGLRREELRERIESNSGKWFPIVKDLPDDVAVRLREAVDENLVQGFHFRNSMKRWYASPTLATHVIGFTGEAGEKNENDVFPIVGKFGVEAAMEEFLAGRDGWREHRRDARGLVVPGDATSLLPPRAGLNVQLTLDLGIQAIVEEELDAGLAEFNAEQAAVVLMDPETGEILALASRPNFDLNRKEDIGKPNVNFNYAIQAANEPGSVIKIVATSGALNEGLVTPQTSIFCHNGYFQDGPIWVRDQYPKGNITFETILQTSNNIGTYKLGRQLGMSRFYDYLHAYGFGGRTGILLSGESPGMARNSGNPMDFSRATYGYAMTLTPLQVACAYSVIAGDGCLREPRIVKALVANDGTVVENYPPKIVRRVLKERVAAQMRTALEKVVGTPQGTATRAAVPGFRVAGKTGTARKVNSSGKYSTTRKAVTFAGMMPADDPAFVCVVVVNEPEPVGFNAGGGTVAAPIFQKIAARVAARLNLQPTEPVPDPLASTTPR